MRYQSRSIKYILQMIAGNQLYLPSIQRKFVWDEERITDLLDSIMCDYPIGTFIFWKISGEGPACSEKKYNFILHYDEEDNVNTLAPAPNIYFPYDVVLDGQQRLTALYIALQGTYCTRSRNRREKIRREAYFNLDSPGMNTNDINNESDTCYQFEFLPDQGDFFQKSDQSRWYKLKNILTYSSQGEVMVFAYSHGFTEQEMNNLARLHEHFASDSNDSINYFETDKQSLDDVLEIFIRVNSGGMPLAKSDLLFATITAAWEEGRDNIDALLKEINAYGNGFSFSNDFIMRACLYVADLKVSLKQRSFRTDSVQRIRDCWNSIADSIRKTVELLVELGFHEQNITSYAAILPVVYYIYHNGVVNDIVKTELQKYLVSAMLKQMYGKSNDTVLHQVREKLKENLQNPFCASQLYDIRFARNITLKYDEEEIDALFDLDKSAYTFMLLTLLYSKSIRYDQVTFHQDHLHPYSAFDKRNLRREFGDNLSDDEISELKKRANTLPNLQLLEGVENQQKNKKPLEEWLYSTPEHKVRFLPEGVPLSFTSCRVLWDARKTEMKKALKAILLDQV